MGRSASHQRWSSPVEMSSPFLGGSLHSPALVVRCNGYFRPISISLLESNLLDLTTYDGVTSNASTDSAKPRCRGRAPAWPSPKQGPLLQMRQLRPLRRQIAPPTGLPLNAFSQSGICAASAARTQSSYSCQVSSDWPETVSNVMPIPPTTVNWGTTFDAPLRSPPTSTISASADLPAPGSSSSLRLRSSSASAAPGASDSPWAPGSCRAV